VRAEDAPETAAGSISGSTPATLMAKDSLAKCPAAPREEVAAAGS
jgi:hypothetical protein